MTFHFKKIPSYLNNKNPNNIMKRKMLQYCTAFLVAFVILFSSCKKDEVNHAPVISLSGFHTMEWPLNEPFIDPGYSAIDAEDGDLTDSVSVTELDINMAGEQKLYYGVSDLSGNVDTVTRIVKVVNQANSFEGILTGDLVLPYPGAEPVKYDEEVILSESVNNQITVVNFGNNDAVNIDIRLYTKGAKKGMIELAEEGVTLNGEALSLIADKSYFKTDPVILLATYIAGTDTAQLRLMK